MERYDEATVDLVYATSGVTRADACAILDKLAEAGLLLPPGGVTREEWATPLPFGYLMAESQRTATSTHRRMVTTWPGPGPNDNWPRYVGPWAPERPESIDRTENGDQGPEGPRSAP